MTLVWHQANWKPRVSKDNRMISDQVLIRCECLFEQGGYSVGHWVYDKHCWNLSGGVSLPEGTNLEWVYLEELK